MKVKEESEKVGLKLNIQKTKIMASGPITSWEIDGETVETVSDFILGGSKITADDNCSHEIKRRLLLGRKVMTNLDSIFKSRDSTLPTKVHLVKTMVFPVVMYGCESWTQKKAECWRIDAFELWCWRRLLRVPWTAKRSILSVHWKDWHWSWNSITLATWYEELTHLRRPWSWERLRAGGEGDDRGWDGWMASPTQWTWVWVDSGRWWWTGRPGMGLQRVRHDWAPELNWLKCSLSWVTLPCVSIATPGLTRLVFWRLDDSPSSMCSHPLEGYCELIPATMAAFQAHTLGLLWVHLGLVLCYRHWVLLGLVDDKASLFDDRGCEVTFQNARIQGREAHGPFSINLPEWSVLRSWGKIDLICCWASEQRSKKKLKRTHVRKKEGHERTMSG